MNRLTEKVTIGCLLHDVGKLIYRADTLDGRNHSQSGYEFISCICNDDEIGQCIRFHHKQELMDADISQLSPAYITYIADNIAAGADRRPNDTGNNVGFQKDMPLYSVFNLLNGDSEDMSVGFTNHFESMPIPTSEAKKISASDYNRIVADMKTALSAVDFKSEYINSVLEVMGSFTSLVPSSTNTKEMADISLFDHSKMTACVGSCISEYLQEKEIKDYKTELLHQEKQFLDKKAFLMLSFDLSGIQSFIYSIDYEDALKSLRMRSFFLELFMEHCIDTVLEEVGLSRANLIYSGGGHCYILLPNTNKVKAQLEQTVAHINRWLIEQFATSLYLSAAYVECSGNDLMNQPADCQPYSQIFLNLSKQLNRIKMNKYSADEIRLLNQPSDTSTRECKICGRISRLSETKDVCQLCAMFSSVSSSFISNDVYVITKAELTGIKGVPFPAVSGNAYVYAVDESKARALLSGGNVLRIYFKNKPCTGIRYATKIFVGDYAYSNKISDLLSGVAGIKRMAVLRMDVDNLGLAFVKGFERNTTDITVRYRYVTLSRTAAFSRQLSMFFKFYINQILKDCNNGENRVSIVYSGGDDVFLIGAWDDVIQSAILISDTFKQYSMNRLTLSAGIGIFGEKYPLFKSARETEELEEKSKSVQGKNSVTLFTAKEEHTYHWDTLKNNVIGEKLNCIKSFFDSEDSEKGKAALYRILTLLRESREKINIARYAYLLARMEPKDKTDKSKKQIYYTFSKNMYQWILDETDKQQLITAIYIYLYKNRKG